MFLVLIHAESWQHEFCCLLYLSTDVTCVTSNFLYPLFSYVTRRHNNVNPFPPRSVTSLMDDPEPFKQNDRPGEGEICRSSYNVDNSHNTRWQHRSTISPLTDYFCPCLLYPQNCPLAGSPEPYRLTSGNLPGSQKHSKQLDRRCEQQSFI